MQTQTQKLLFQIKRDYSDHTPKGFASWLNEKVFTKKNSGMAGTNLVIFLGVPKDGSPVEIGKFYDEFTKKCIQNNSFDKVLLLYNDGGGGYIVLHEFYPIQKRRMIDSKLAMARFRGEA